MKAHQRMFATGSHTWEEGETLQLEAKNISIYYGAIKALEDVSFYVNPGEIVAMIGPNGAGKSTALKAVFGMVDVKAGHILYEGKKIKDLRPDEHVSKGISMIPEGRRLFPSMTVIENLEMGAFLQPTNAKIEQGIEEIYKRFPALKPRSKKPAGTLSGGERQQLAIGRALMASPKLLMMDEPSMGSEKE